MSDLNRNNLHHCTPSGASIKNVMLEGGGGVRVRMTNNVEECMKKHDGGGVKNAP